MSSPYPEQAWDSPVRVVLTERRWTATLTVTMDDGTVHEVLLSADGAHTQGSGIYVGTAEDAREMEERW